MNFPIVHNNHTLEEKSILYFRKHLPPDWITNTVDKDYGQDLNIEICEGGMLKGLDLVIQLKSSQESNAINDNERQSFSISTYNYLNANVRIVMVIKYVKEDDEAYWILLKDVPKPNQENETLTIYIPRKNKISSIKWDNIVFFVREVTETMITFSKALSQVFDTGKFIKGGFDLAALYENRWQKFIKIITENVAPENIISGHPAIVIPAMEGLNLQYENSILSEMFINLLSASMDSTKQGLAHPAFPNIIKQLSRDEAVTLRYMKKNIIRFHTKQFVGKYIVDYHAPENLECNFPKKVLHFPEYYDAYITHLISLNLIVEIETRIYTDESYVLTSKERILTKFGKLFAEACVPDINKIH